MNILSSIFGSENVIKHSMSAIDAMVFTDEEKVKAKMELLDHYKPFKLAQRLLALMFSSVFLLVYVITIFIWIFGSLHSNVDYSLKLIELAVSLAKWNTETLSSIIFLILGFYFAGGVMNWTRK